MPIREENGKIIITIGGGHKLTEEDINTNAKCPKCGLPVKTLDGWTGFPAWVKFECPECGIQVDSEIEIR